MTEDLSKLNQLLSQPDAINKNHDKLISSCSQFIEKYDSSIEETEESSSRVDELRTILFTMTNDMIPMGLEVLLSRVLKILLRKSCNRLSIGKSGVSSIVYALKRQTSSKPIVASEVCNIVLNTCYEGANIRSFLEEGGLPIVLRLIGTSSRDSRLQASALGALQGICYTSLGRQYLLADTVTSSTGGLNIVINLLLSQDKLVRARASGTIHNMSTDIQSFEILGNTNSESPCIQSLVTLLHDPSIEICKSAAGTLQNISRHPSLRLQIMEDDRIITYLTDLLFSNDINCQVSAVGALLNLLGPSLGEEQRMRLRQVLSESVALGAIKSAVFETT